MERWAEPAAKSYLPTSTARLTCKRRRYTTAGMKSAKTIMFTIGISTAMILAPAPALNAAFDTFLVLCTQGNSGKPCKNNNNNGTTTTTETGPKGAIKNGKTPDNTVSTTTCGPGNSKGC
jgi:hypothetical protein